MHTREVTLDRPAQAIDIADTLEGDAPVAARITFQLGPAISCALEDDAAVLTWDDHQVVATLPAGLEWRVEQGSTDPIDGWYSPSFGTKMAAAVMIGVGTIEPGATLHTRFHVGEVDDVTDPQTYESASSGGPR